MVSACILICCEPRRYPDVAEKAKEVKGVVKAFSTSGRWDAIAQVKVGDMKALTEVSLRINGLSGVWATETLVEAVL